MCLVIFQNVVERICITMKWWCGMRADCCAPAENEPKEMAREVEKAVIDDVAVVPKQPDVHGKMPTDDSRVQRGREEGRHCELFNKLY